MKQPDVALSCSHSSRRWAEKIARELEAEQFVVWFDSPSRREVPGQAWNQGLTEVIAAAHAVVFVIDDHPPDVWQQAEWSAALETSWQNPDQILVAILLGDAEVPSFLNGRQALRVRDPKTEWTEATRELVNLLRGDTPPSAALIVVAEQDPSRRAARQRSIDEAIRALEKERS